MLDFAVLWLARGFNPLAYRVGRFDGLDSREQASLALQ